MEPQNARDILYRAAEKYASYWRGDKKCFNDAMEWMPLFADYVMVRVKEGEDISKKWWSGMKCPVHGTSIISVSGGPIEDYTIIYDCLCKFERKS